MMQKASPPRLAFLREGDSPVTGLCEERSDVATPSLAACGHGILPEA